jgi:ribosomal protein S18 acetylase RimI-like enzyme
VTDPSLETRRIAVALTRPLRQAVLRPHQTQEELAGHEPSDAFAVGVFESDELIAVGLIGSDGPPGSWRVRGMATAAHARGRGAGTAVLRALLNHAIANGATRIWCNARVAALSLYERAGFRTISEPFDEPNIGRHYVMERLTSD